MRPNGTIRIFSFTLAIGVFLLIPAQVKAGFICANADEVTQNSLLEVKPAPASSGATEQPEETPIPPRFDDTESEAFPESGMSSSHSTITSHTGGGAFAALPTLPIDIPTLLLSRLGPEGRVWLPPPFSTGVFRPPRFV